MKDIRRKLAELLYKIEQDFIKKLLVNDRKSGYYRTGSDYIICSPIVFKLKRQLENSYTDLDLDEKQVYLDRVDQIFKSSDT